MNFSSKSNSGKPFTAGRAIIVTYLLFLRLFCLLYCGVYISTASLVADGDTVQSYNEFFCSKKSLVERV